MLYDIVKDIMDESVKNHDVPFSEIAITKDNELICRYKNGPLKGDELYFLYSASKPITCTAALQLYEKGLIDLDDCVYKYLPEYKQMKLKTKNGVKDAENPITIRHLFTMTSGINYNISSKSIKEIVSQNPNASTMDIVKAIAKEPLEFEPGTHWLYGLNHDVLAGIIEIVSGMKFGEYLKKNIFELCEMEKTCLYYNNDMHICDQYRYDSIRNRVVPMKKENGFIITPNYESGGAGIISCVEDYMKFANALINTEILLKTETLSLMNTPHISGDAYIDFQNCKKGYSYGLGVRTNENGFFSAKGEFGWDGAAGAYVLMDPERHLVVFYVTHIRDYGFYQYEDLHLKLRDAVYNYFKE